MWHTPITHPKSGMLLSILLAGFLSLETGCITNEMPPSTVTPIAEPEVSQGPPPIGAADFRSADATHGAASPQDPSSNADGDMASEASAEDAGGANEGERSRAVEEGDIYRLVNSSLLVNLNSYRGLIYLI